MAWQTPKTDWAPPDGVRNTDINRIEGNILELYNTGMVHADNTVYVASTGSDTSGKGTSVSPYATITKALSTIPRNITDKNVTISIAAGTYLDNVVIKGFTGTLNIVTTGLATIRSLTIDGCNVTHSGSQLNVQAGIVLTNGASFTGSAILYIGVATTGVSVQSGSSFAVFNTITISNATIAAEVYGNARAYFAILAGTGNSSGLVVTNGGIATYGSMSLAATTQRTTNTGGRIYSGAQTSVPNY